MSKKRYRDKSTVDTDLVEIYEDLANADENVRLTAAHALLTKFVAVQETNGDQLDRILKRLIRGLCSGRKAARIGFSIALTEFLTELFGPRRREVSVFQDINGILRTLQEQTNTPNGASGQVSTLSSIVLEKK